MSYTLQQIDNACTAIGGPNTVRPGDWGWNRPMTMITCASKAWIDQYPEDEHTQVLREALQDMNKYGKLQYTE